MRVGFVALGKLGLPCAVATAMKGHDVMGYDLDPDRMTHEPQPYQEAGPNGTGDFNDFLAESPIRFGTLEEVVDHAQILFVSVQTPHDERYEGITRVPEQRKDFDYKYLQLAIHDIAVAVGRRAERELAKGLEPSPVAVVIISTVLPGTIRKSVWPFANHHMHLCYNPFFIAMGTTMRDFLEPEFVLLGTHSEWAAGLTMEFYTSIVGHEVPIYKTTIESAELIKVAYNTFISMKIVFANTLMELSHKLDGCNVDAVTNALKLGHRRILAPTYMEGGMGDGGGCHPRDNIALSWVAGDLGLSFDIFGHLMEGRERQTEWLADLMCERDEALAIVGYAFKPCTNLTVGSPALLLKNILEERGKTVKMWDPRVDGPDPPDWLRLPYCILIGTKHPELASRDFPFSPGTVVLDPWRYIPEHEGVEIIRIGA